MIGVIVDILQSAALVIFWFAAFRLFEHQKEINKNLHNATKFQARSIDAIMKRIRP